MGEFICILLIVILGVMFLFGVDELVMIFVFLEILSIFFYLLIGYIKCDFCFNEVVLKYLFIGVVSFVVFFYGIFLFYGLFGGEIWLIAIVFSFVSGIGGGIFLVLVIVLVFIIVGIFFKIFVVFFY